jgi:hypothetical protein
MTEPEMKHRRSFFPTARFFRAKASNQDPQTKAQPVPFAWLSDINPQTAPRAVDNSPFNEPLSLEPAVKT